MNCGRRAGWHSGQKDVSNPPAPTLLSELRSSGPPGTSLRTRLAPGASPLLPRLPGDGVEHPLERLVQPDDDRLDGFVAG